MFSKLTLLSATSFVLLAAAQSCDVLSPGLMCCHQTLSGSTIVGLNCSSTNVVEILLGSCLTGNLACCENGATGGLTCTTANYASAINPQTV
ncbi:hypothetical protein A0H81_02282 [Grifola frondosa]|uniref:Hydrophobin n=1 Tax=Grifola frondosa TaxID=5627 RepID=A0A1C7MMP0_GRIFR|nr:hypothetical protein A0H81_02282 [Grifola frondosa]